MGRWGGYLQKLREDSACSEQKTEFFLPREIISGILVKLPLKSVGRCKCVCKLWYAVVEERNFIEEHMKQADLVYMYGENHSNITTGGNEEFSFLFFVDGLVLEKSSMTNKYRVRNPTTKKILDLPDPPVTPDTMQMLYVRATNNYKLTCVYGSKGIINGACGVLTLGTDLIWRILDIPSLYDLGSKGVWSDVICNGNLFFIAKFCDAEFGNSEIICLDMESEHFVNIRIPQAFFSSWKNVRLFLWDKKLSLFDRVNREFHVHILEDYKKQHWAQTKRVIHLSFLSEYPEFQDLYPYAVENGWLWYFPADGHHTGYDIESKRVHIANHLPPNKRNLGFFECSLVNLDKFRQKDLGVQPAREVKSEEIQPNEEVNLKAIQPKKNPNKHGPEY